MRSHGGPTAGTGQGFFGSIQYLVSRGIAVVDVDYGGSTGYGRAYRSRLDGEWGVVDVDDCLNAGRYLASIGEVDPARMACEGGSASGYTTLAMLAFRPGAMAAGVSYFGIGDLTGFDLTTHKFESRYTERLVGPLPETEALWRERSPILHAERISVPMLILQGLDDKVVPPSQAEQIVAGLAAKGIPHAYLRLRGRGPRLPQAREHPPLVPGGALVLRPGLRLHARRRAAAAGARPRLRSGARSGGRRAQAVGRTSSGAGRPRKPK